MTTATDADHKVAVTSQAVHTLANCRDQVALVSAVWSIARFDPNLALATATTFGRQLADLMQTGLGRDTTVMRDGELSFYVRTQSGVVYGLIFHPTHRADPPTAVPDAIRFWGTKAPREGVYCVHRDDDRTCLTPYSGGKPTCEGHTPDPMVLPVPGEWSFHS